MKSSNNLVSLEVFKPFTGIATSLRNAPRLDTLEGKTICEISGGLGFGQGKTFPVIRELLHKQFPSAKLVPYTELPQALGTHLYTAQLDIVAAAIKEKHCDAIIVGNGG